LPYFINKWIGNARSALGLGEYRGSSLFWAGSRENLQTVPGYRASGTPPKFLFDHVIGTVRLRRVDDFSTDRVGDQVSQLQTGRVVLLIHEANLQVVHGADGIPAVAYPAKRQLQPRIFGLTSALNL
jgi:hypothetical protein